MGDTTMTIETDTARTGAQSEGTSSPRQERSVEDSLPQSSERTTGTSPPSSFPRTTVSRSVSRQRSLSSHATSATDSTDSQSLARGSSHHLHRRQRRSVRQRSHSSLLSTSQSSSAAATFFSNASSPREDATVMRNDTDVTPLDGAAASSTNSGPVARRLSAMRGTDPNAATEEPRRRRTASRSRSTTALFESRVDLSKLQQSQADSTAIGYLETHESEGHMNPSNKPESSRRHRRAPSRTRSSDDAVSPTKQSTSDRRRTMRTKSIGSVSTARSSQHHHAQNHRSRPTSRDSSTTEPTSPPTDPSTSPPPSTAATGLLDRHVSRTSHGQHRRRHGSDDLSLCSRESRQSLRHTRLRGAIRRPSTQSVAAAAVTAEGDGGSAIETKHGKEKARARANLAGVVDKASGTEMEHTVRKDSRRVKKSKEEAGGASEKEPKTSKSGKRRTNPDNPTSKQPTGSLQEKKSDRGNDEANDNDAASVLSMEDYDLCDHPQSSSNNNASDDETREVSLEYDFESGPIPRKTKLHIASKPPVTARGKISAIAKKTRPLELERASIAKPALDSPLLVKRAALDASRVDLVSKHRITPELDQTMQDTTDATDSPDKQDSMHAGSLKKQLSLRGSFRLRQGSFTSATGVSNRSMRAKSSVTSYISNVTRKVFRKGSSKRDALDDDEDVENGRPAMHDRAPSLQNVLA